MSLMAVTGPPLVLPKCHWIQMTFTEVRTYPLEYSLFSCPACYAHLITELLFHTAGHDEHIAFLHQGVVTEDAASHTPDLPVIPAGRTPTEEAVERVKADLIDLLWERINILERTLREAKVRARVAEQKNQDFQREIRALKAEVRRLSSPGRDHP